MPLTVGLALALGVAISKTRHNLPVDWASLVPRARPTCRCLAEPGNHIMILLHASLTTVYG